MTRSLWIWWAHPICSRMDYCLRSTSSQKSQPTCTSRPYAWVLRFSPSNHHECKSCSAEFPLIGKNFIFHAQNPRPRIVRTNIEIVFAVFFRIVFVFRLVCLLQFDNNFMQQIVQVLYIGGFFQVHTSNVNLENLINQIKSLDTCFLPGIRAFLELWASSFFGLWRFKNA